MADRFYDSSEGEFVDFETLEDWESRDKEKDKRIEELEAKLALAVKAFEEIKRYSPCGDSRRKAIDTLAELKGQKDE